MFSGQRYLTFEQLGAEAYLIAIITILSKSFLPFFLLKDTTKSTTVSSPTPTGTTAKTQNQVARQLQNPTPRSKGVSAWVIIVIVLAAMAVVLITVFLLYRWNHRYTGSFKPSKSEEAQSQDPGADAEQQQGSWMYNQPPFFVYKPAKKTTKAQSPPVSI